MAIAPMYLWLIAGVILAVLELHFAGIGLFFAGLGALTVGTALWCHALADEALVTQGVLFFGATAFWAVLLWKPIQKFRRPSPGYNNIIGETAYAGTRLTKNDGDVTWSGTIMKAKLAQNALVEMVEPGTLVVVVEVRGATLIVEPKK